jgi:hypothetical protein
MLNACSYIALGYFANEQTTVGTPVCLCFKVSDISGMTRLEMLFAEGFERLLDNLAKPARDWARQFVVGARNAPRHDPEAIDSFLRRISALSVGPFRPIAAGSFLAHENLDDFRDLMATLHYFESQSSAHAT